MKNMLKCLLLMVGLFVMPLSLMAADQEADTYSGKMDEVMNKFAALLESIEDEASAEAASAGITKLTYEEIVPLIKESGKSDDPALEMDLHKKTKAQEKVQATANRVMTAIMKIGEKDPALIIRIQPAIDELNQAMLAAHTAKDVLVKKRVAAEASE